MSVPNPARARGAALLLLFAGPPVFAGGSVEHSSAAIVHSAQAGGHSMVAGVKLVSGAVAIPLQAAGAIGRASGEVGDELWRAANTPEGDPLPIAPEAFSAGPPPGEALEEDGDRPWRR